MTATSDPKIINLDDDDWRNATLVIAFRGVKVPLSHARVLDLLAREHGMFTQLFEGAAVHAPTRPPVDPQAAPQPPATVPAATPVARGLQVSHASLSYRIKRIYDFSVATKSLRPAHAGVLSEMLETFDGTIPQHSSSKLEEHLRQFMRWKSVPPELKQQMEEFLAVYTRARRQS